MKQPVLEVKHVSKSYGNVKVLDDISFSVKENEVIGLIGHNGAGKTTLMESILGLRKGYEGTITLFGRQMTEHPKQLKRMIGAQLQESELNSQLKVYEAVEFQSAAFGLKVDADQYLKDFELTEHKYKKFSKLSGGLKQRLFILLSIVHSPSLIFYDELTTGIDPEARKGMYKYIKNLKNSGKTVFLSTHIMEETQIMCDRVMMLKKVG